MMEQYLLWRMQRLKDDLVSMTGVGGRINTVNNSLETSFPSKSLTRRHKRLFTTFHPPSLLPRTL